MCARRLGLPHTDPSSASSFSPGGKKFSWPRCGERFSAYPALWESHQRAAQHPRAQGWERVCPGLGGHGLYIAQARGRQTKGARKAAGICGYQRPGQETSHTTITSTPPYVSKPYKQKDPAAGFCSGWCCTPELASMGNGRKNNVTGLF